MLSSADGHHHRRSDRCWGKPDFQVTKEPRDRNGIDGSKTSPSTRLRLLHHLHCQLAVAALQAGKHVLLEKPMALSVAECTSVIAAAKASRGKLMIGQIMHFVWPCLVAREILDRGDLGKPVTGSSSLLKTWIESNRRGWHLDPATGGGMLMTAGIDALDQLVWLMDCRVNSVSAAVSTSFHDQKADDSAMMLLRFADGPIWAGGKYRFPRWWGHLRYRHRM
jgi:phthalate 4,5-cis-dihydrodiol dehydrogenase